MEIIVDERSFLASCRQGDIDQVKDYVRTYQVSESILREASLDASRAGHAQLLNFLLDQDAGGDFTFMAHQAMEYEKSVAVLQILKIHGWNVELEGHKVMARAVGEESIIRWFLDHSADPAKEMPRFDGLDPPYLTALNAAANIGSITMVDLLMAHGAKLENNCPLHTTAMKKPIGNGWKRIVDHLIALGLDVNGLDTQMGPYSKGTPLCYALESLSLDGAKYLMDKGADPTIKNRHGQSALDLARFFNRKEFVDLFESAPS